MIRVRTRGTISTGSSGRPVHALDHLLGPGGTTVREMGGPSLLVPVSFFSFRRAFCLEANLNVKRDLSGSFGKPG